jgi:K+-sensing histidine kinase KdpD
MKIDSIALMEMLHEQLKEKGWEFSLEWCCTTLQDEDTGQQSGVVLETLVHHDLPALHVQHMNPFLLGLMWPELMFAMILLTLSASAMIISFRSLKKQLALNGLRNDFIANISHELKTPVSTVKVALEALQKFDFKNDPRVSDEYLGIASRELLRLEGLVGKVLQHQLLEDSESTIQLESCDLRQVLASAMNSMEIPIRECDATMHMPEADLPCMVRADPVYLEGVIINLIDNSLKYAGPNPEIEVEINCSGNTKKLLVRDNGPGIPDEYRTQVFDKFFRIPAGNRHNVKGYGLGLNFATQVMTKVGGSISFRNLSAGGCEFELQFPNK